MIYDLLRVRAECAPEAVVIRAPGRCDLTYGGLLGQVDRVAEFLNARGIHRSDRIAIVLPNGPEMAAAFFGVIASSVCAPLNPAYSRSEFEFYFSDLNPRALIVQSGTNSAVIEVAEKRRIPIIELLPKPEAAAGIFALRGNEQPLTANFGFPQTDDIALVLHTSGTTSRPKMVPLTHANLLASARNVAATLRLTAADRCLNVMPLFHIHGLVGALLSSVIAGASAICPSGFDIEQFLSWLDAFQPTWYTAVPTIHHAVVSRAQGDPAALRNHSLRFIRSSSSALPARILRGLEELFNVPVLEAYGMTEAAHQMTSNPLPPAQRKVGSVGLPAGPEVSIMDEAGNLLSPGEIGEIVIRGANVTSGYIDSSESNNPCFARGWFRTGDLGYLDNDGYLFITGRLKEIINRGGEKISPREIEDVILQHPAVAEAITFAMPHETLGEDIAAAVVLLENAAVTEGELQRFVAAQLAEFKIPRLILFVDEIPKSSTGKPERVGLAEKLASLLQRIPEFLAPQTQAEKTLAAIWSTVLGVEHIGIRDNFFNLGGDSIRATQVISRIRDLMQIELSISSFFETPTVADLADRIEKTPRPELLQVRPIVPITRNEKLPLSFAQQRLWLLNQLEPVNPVYNRPLALRLAGKLQPEVIERCLNEIVRRHEVLRTNFQDNGDEAVPVISPSLTVDLPSIDLSHLPDSEREAEALRQARRESQQTFDLTRGALLRTRLYRLGEQDHLWLFVTHHIVFDGWSDSVLLGEIAALYPAIINGSPTPLTDLSIQYIDYATWQRQQNDKAALDADLSYWKGQLNNSPPLLNLPTDRPRPAVRSCRGARKVFTLPAVLSKSLKELSSREQVTLFMTLAAAFNALLYRYTGQEDILVGVPTAGRNRVETEPLLGVFINTLVVRTDLSGAPSFRDLLRRVRGVALSAYTHQDLPFEKLIEVLQPDRDLSRNPLFDVMFQLRNTPHQNMALQGLRVDCIDLDIGVAKFDLTLEVIDETEGLVCRCEYSTDLFDSATITRMAEHFQTLLEGIVADPEQNIATLPLLTAQERHQLLIEWNDTEADYPADKSIHQLFEEQAEKTPDAVAVVYANQGLTYRDLNAKANQLAHYLKKLGVGPDVLVGICVERSLEMMVGLLGIVKAGGAYVPLDPSYPKERLDFMLEDTDVAVLLTQEPLLKLFADQNRQVICLDTELNDVANASPENPARSVTPDNLAYVIYTSGSTGKPKGVTIPHRGILRLLYGVDYVQLDDHQTFLQLAPLSFDASTFEIWGPLLHGAKCVLYPGSVPTPTELAEFLHQHGITTLWLTAALYNAVIEEAPQALFGIKQLLIGGEALSVTHVLRGLALLPHTQIINGYGPTEGTTFTCCYPIPRDLTDPSVTSIPLGRPIGNTQVYILDQQRNPVPVGVTGELHIGGDGLARGYLNRPELTAEKFIANPFRTEPHARLYKTGDLARYLADGNIEFLGRIDDQVKIRGFRIEPGEVIAVLNAHSGVKTSHVLALPQRSGDVGLTAYYVEDNTASNPPTAGELRGFLAERLPNYMVPVAFVSITKLPLTPNGKIDRQALIDSHCQDIQSRHEYVAPRDETEAILCKLWGEILKLDRVGIDDDFFAIGGHSLLAAKLFSRLDEHFGRSLPLGVLFAAPTVRALADRYRASVRQKTRALVALREAGFLPPIFAVPGVFGNVVGFAELCRELGLGQPFYGLQSVGLDGSEPPLSSIEDMAVLYISEIRTVQPRGPYILFGVCFGATVAYEMAHQLLAQGEKVTFLGLLDPTRREGNDLREGSSPIPRAFRRAAAVGSLALGRLHLYAEELKRISGKNRIKFFMRKFRLLGRLVKKIKGLNGTHRELNQIEVYHTNLAALDHYRRRPLDGEFTAVEIFHTARLVNWNTPWSGSIVRHLMPGKDSGDMLSGSNVKILATLLAKRLSESLGETSASPGARQANHTDGTERT